MIPQNIPKEQIPKALKQFEKIKQQFLQKTKVPKENNWKSWTNNDIWLHLITQVIVVGSSAPAHKFEENPKLQEQVSYEKLIELADKKEIEIAINRVLRAVGTRYASSDISKCRKTQALAHNLKILKSLKEGPRGLLKRISEFEGKNSDIRKIKYLMKIFKYIQSKSARDYLMELGLVKNAIALDIRVKTILEKLSIKIPKGFENNPKLYDQIEKEILNSICKPLNLSGVELDRMLYQNYNDITKMLTLERQDA
jgi:hypothetical protein